LFCLCLFGFFFFFALFGCGVLSFVWYCVWRGGGREGGGGGGGVWVLGDVGLCGGGGGGKKTTTSKSQDSAVSSSSNRQSNCSSTILLCSFQSFPTSVKAKSSASDSFAPAVESVANARRANSSGRRCPPWRYCLRAVSSKSPQSPGLNAKNCARSPHFHRRF